MSRVDSESKGSLLFADSVTGLNWPKIVKESKLREPKGRLSRMAWVFHVDHGVGEVRSREGTRARVEFSGRLRTVSDGFRAVPESSSWVLAKQEPDQFLQLLREDPEWVVREQLADVCGKVTVKDVEEHLASIGISASDIGEWRDLISSSSGSSDHPSPARVEDSHEFSPGREDSNDLGARVRVMLEDLADPGSTDIERLGSIRRLENLAPREPVSSGDSVVARILGCRGFDDSTPLSKIRLVGVGKQFLENLIARCDSAVDLATLALIVGTTSQAKLAIAPLATSDQACLQGFFVELLESAATSLRSDRETEEEPTTSDIRRILSRVVMMNETPSSSVVAAMLRVRASAAAAGTKAMTKTVDGYLGEMRPSAEVLRSAVNSTADLPADMRTACLNSLPFEVRSTRVLYLAALIDASGPTILDTKDPWEKITIRDLASGWPLDHPVLTAMLQSDCGRKIAASTVRRDIDAMDAERLGLLLALRPDVRALVSDELFVGAIERLARRNPNVAKLPELLAQPYIEKERAELRRQESVLDDRQQMREVEFDQQISEYQSQIAELQRDLEQARSRIASRTSEVRGAHGAELRQAVVNNLKDCAQMVTNLQTEEGNEDLLGKLERALSEPGLVILDKPGEIVAFDPERHERLGVGSSREVEVVLSAIGYSEGGSVTVIRRGSVRSSG